MRRRMPPLNAIRAFEASARHNGFAPAADELAVTPSAVSQQVKQLEEWLGLPLFERLPRGIALTPTGRRLLPSLTQGLDVIAQAARQAIESNASPTLTISTVPTLSAMWLVPRLYRFMDQNPEIDARISSASRLVDFDRDDVDCALRFGKGNWPDVYSEKLIDVMLAPVCSPKLLPALRSPDDLRGQVLLHEEFLFANPSYGASWQDWLDAAGVAGIDAKRGHQFSEGHLALHAAMAGRGVAMGRTLATEAELAAGRLVAPFELQLDSKLSYWFVCAKNRAQEPKIKAFRDWLFEELDRPPPGLE